MQGPIGAKNEGIASEGQPWARNEGIRKGQSGTRSEKQTKTPEDQRGARNEGEIRWHLKASEGLRGRPQRQAWGGRGVRQTPFIPGD